MFQRSSNFHIWYFLYTPSLYLNFSVYYRGVRFGKLDWQFDSSLIPVNEMKFNGNSNPTHKLWLQTIVIKYILSYTDFDSYTGWGLRDIQLRSVLNQKLSAMTKTVLVLYIIWKLLNTSDQRCYFSLTLKQRLSVLKVMKSRNSAVQLWFALELRPGYLILMKCM